MTLVPSRWISSDFDVWESKILIEMFNSCVLLAFVGPGFSYPEHLGLRNEKGKSLA